VATRRAPLRQVEPPKKSPAAELQVRAVYAEQDDPVVLDKLADLLLQLLRDPKAK